MQKPTSNPVLAELTDPQTARPGAPSRPDARTPRSIKLTPARTGKCGRSALKGQCLATFTELSASAVFALVTVPPRRREGPGTCTACGTGPFHTRPVKVILARGPSTTERFDIALASTDSTATAAALFAGTTAARQSRPAIQKPKPTSSAKHATASRKKSTGSFRSGS